MFSGFHDSPIREMSNIWDQRFGSTENLPRPSFVTTVRSDSILGFRLNTVGNSCLTNNFNGNIVGNIDDAI